MIDSLTYKQIDDNLMPWASELDYFKTTPVTQFKPGLNILFGGNGSGKSTLLQLLATSLAAAQGGTSVVTSSWLHDLFGFGNKGASKLPCDVVHDGQPVMFFDARAKEGLIGGGFDDDFFNLGIANTMARGSTGQLGLQRIDRMLKVLTSKEDAAPPPAAEPQANRRSGRSLKDLARPGGTQELVSTGFPSKVEWRVNHDFLAKHESERIAAVDALLAARCPEGPKTLIFDEPESGFSMPWQVGLWNNVFSKVDPARFQVIVATHSPFAIGIPGTNYIEMKPGYLRECLNAAQRFVDRLVPGQKDIV
jgi:predicted ATPase